MTSQTLTPVHASTIMPLVRASARTELVEALRPLLDRARMMVHAVPLGVLHPLPEFTRTFGLRALRAVIGSFIAVLLYSGLSISPAWVFDLEPGPSRPFLRIGHRGAAGLAPENTLSAISAALEHGVDRIEIDVRQTRDGRIVLMHDASLERTAGVPGEVKDYTYAELARLDVGRWFSPRFAGETIPTLEQAIAQVDDRAELLIEIKEGSDYTPGIERNVLKIIEDAGCRERCAIHSFQTDVLERVHALDPSIRLHKLFIGKLKDLPVVLKSATDVEYFDIDDHPYIEEYSINYHYMNRGIIAKLVARGKKVNVWTVDSPELAEDLLALGVDGIITDYPNRLPSVAEISSRHASNDGLGWHSSDGTRR